MDQADSPLRGIALTTGACAVLAIADTTSKYLSTSLPIIEIQWIRYVPAPASVLAPISYIQLPWVAITGFLVFNNLPDHWTLVGATIIIASGLYSAQRERVRAHRESVRAHREQLRAREALESR